MRSRDGYENIAHLYDLFDTKNNIDFFHKYARRAGEILDIGAGTGRIALPLAAKGIKVCAVEPSPDMRREFSGKLSQRPDLAEIIVLVSAEAKSFDLGRTFSVAFLSGCFDHFLDDRERILALRNIHKHLVPGGVLVFDIYPGFMREAPLHPAGKVRCGDLEYRRFIETKIIDQRCLALRLVYEIYEDERLLEVIEGHSSAGIADRSQVHRLLHEAGFEPVAEYGDFDFREYQAGDEVLIIEAVRK